eukprot:GHUV01027681.1.p1 GENE.GHUV01027681.1~~GHUV01027681.1.p1  ORF type:complete len:158 (+),score=17.28 GHUV01027681.1:481-954(+)
MSPTLMLIDPSAGPPTTSPALVGEYTGTLYWYWSNRESSGRVDYIGKVMFGDYHCYFSDQAGSDVFNPSTDYYSSMTYYLRQDGAYRLRCSLPNKNNTWTLEVCVHAGVSVITSLTIRRAVSLSTQHTRCQICNSVQYGMFQTGCSRSSAAMKARSF